MVLVKKSPKSPGPERDPSPHLCPPRRGWFQVGGVLLQSVAGGTERPSLYLLVLIPLLASVPSLSIPTTAPSPTRPPLLCSPVPSTVVPPRYTGLHGCLNVTCETTEGHAVFAASQGKNVSDPFGIKSTHKQPTWGPLPASSTGVVRAGQLGIKSAKHFPRNNHSPITCILFLGLLCPQTSLNLKHGSLILF